MGCGYVWTNTVNGKQYVGITIKPKERRLSHLNDVRTGRGFYFHNAMRKHGEAAFTYEELFWSDSRDELIAWEIAEIARRGTMDPEADYNLTKGGDGCVLAPEAEARRIAAMLATFATPENKAKRSAATKASWARPEVKANRSIGMREAHARPETKARQSASLKAAFACPELRARIAATSKAVHARPGMKAKQSAASKAALARPETRAKMLATNARPETRARRSIAAQATQGRPEVRAAIAVALNALSPNVFCDGAVFVSMIEAERQLGLGNCTVFTRCTNPKPRFKWWHTIPNHNDPDCDAVEECWALMQWAAANPVHANVPAWLRPKHGPAPAWAKRAAA